MPPSAAKSCEVSAEEAARYLLVPALLSSEIPERWLGSAWGSTKPPPRFTSLTSMIPGVRALLLGPKTPLAPGMSPLEFRMALATVRVVGASVYAFHRHGLQGNYLNQYYAVLFAYYRLLVSEYVRVECSDEPFIYRVLLNCEVRRDVQLGQVDYKPFLEELLVGFRATNGWDTQDATLLHPLGQKAPRTVPRKAVTRMGVMGVLGMLPAECDEHAVLALNEATCVAAFRFPDEDTPIWEKGTLLSVLRPERSFACYEADNPPHLRDLAQESLVPAHAIPPARATKFGGTGAGSSAQKRPLREDEDHEEGPPLTELELHQRAFGPAGFETSASDAGVEAWDGSGSSTGLKRHTGSSQMYFVHTDDPFDAALHAHVRDMHG